MRSPTPSSPLTLIRRSVLALLLIGAAAQASALEVIGARTPFELGRNDQRH